MNNSIQVFKSNDFSVRTSKDDDGTIWFVARDIAAALEYSEASVSNMDKTISTSIRLKPFMSVLQGSFALKTATSRNTETAVGRLSLMPGSFGKRGISMTLLSSGLIKGVRKHE